MVMVMVIWLCFGLLEKADADRGDGHGICRKML